MERSKPVVSVVMATHNRRAVVLDTLRRISTLACGVPLEIVVVDNASGDGTVEAIRGDFPRVHLLPSSVNLGSCAKAAGVSWSSGEYLLFLDDDSYPHAGSIERMVSYFEWDDRLGAVGFRVHLPESCGEECGALPDVFVGCGVGLRRSAYEEVGGLDVSFFMQAEEYDLAFRLARAGYGVRLFDDLHVDHLKTAQARRSARTVFYDTRNNLIVAARHLPDAYYAVYSRDWLQRYSWMAVEDSHRSAFARGASFGWVQAVRERSLCGSDVMDAEALEHFFGWDATVEKMVSLKRRGVSRILLAGLGKNVYAYFRGAVEAGLEILGIADERFATAGRSYRGVPVLVEEEGLGLGADVVVVSDMAPVHAARRAERLRDRSRVAVENWTRVLPKFEREPRALGRSGESMSGGRNADDKKSGTLKLVGPASAG